ncbi:MAG: YkgJ family cysteine cluster protein [bacterium]
MTEIDACKETILKEYPRYTLEDAFSFRCHKGAACFTECCGDVNIVLTPYDIIRMKNKLNITSEEFLSKYTVSPFNKEQRLPVIILKMSDDENKRCCFVSDEGCTIYEDRPWACRMYPLGLASPKDDDQANEEFYFIVKEDTCFGFNEDMEWTIREWVKDQGIDIYNKMGALFKEITLHEYFQRGGNLLPEKMEMFYMVSYNLDKFKIFLFESSFFRRFEVEDEMMEKIKSDEIELMKFGFNWLRFCLFGEKTMIVKEEEAEAIKGKTSS